MTKKALWSCRDALVVERTFAWLTQARRLSKDYERLTASSEAMISLALTRLMLRRLAAT
jgi:putative transposase